MEQLDMFVRCEICRLKSATERCARGGIDAICRLCHAAKRMAYRCQCMSLEQAMAIHETRRGAP